MGLPAKCTFCGAPGKEGHNTSMSGDVKLVWPEFHAYFGRGFNIPHESAKFIEFYTSL